MEFTRIEVDVCGQIFKPTMKTLNKSELFRIILKTNGIPTTPIRIDRSPKLFQHVLAYLIDPTYSYPLKYTNELLFYGIIFEPNKKIVENMVYVPRNL